MGNLIIGDVKTGTVKLSDSLEVSFKDDKDPKASLEMMKMIADMMLKKMASTEVEFFASSAYIEYNTQLKKQDTGNFEFVPAENRISVVTPKSSNSYKVSFFKKNLILTSTLKARDGGDGELVVEYERKE